jgi:hypothetical protein
MVDQKNLWLQLQQQISQNQNGAVVQLLSSFSPWDWGGKTPPPEGLPYAEWLHLNVVPNEPLADPRAQSSAAGNRFDLAYGAWLNALAVGNLAQDSHYTNLQINFQQAQAKYGQEYANAKQAWHDNAPTGTPAFDAWLKDPAQGGIVAGLQNVREELDAADTQLRDYRKEREQPLKAETDAYDNPEFQSRYFDATTEKSHEQRSWRLIPHDYPIDYVSRITGSNFGGPGKNGNNLKFSFNQSSQTYDYAESFGTGGSEIWGDFFGFGCAGTTKRVEWSKFSDSYTLDFEFEDLTTLEVRPGGWYGNVAGFADGPYAQGYSKYRGDGSGGYFFGPGGSLSRIYTGMTVAYRPKIKITSSTEFAQYLHTEWQREGGIWIGPFLLGGEESGESTSSSARQTGSSVEFSSNASWPVIVGMHSDWTYKPQS